MTYLTRPSNQSTQHTFYPIAVETLSPLNEDARLLLSDLGKRISAASGDLREVSFLFQRISVVVQRLNAVLLYTEQVPFLIIFLQLFDYLRLCACGFLKSPLNGKMHKAQTLISSLFNNMFSMSAILLHGSGDGAATGRCLVDESLRKMTPRLDDRLLQLRRRRACSQYHGVKLCQKLCKLVQVL